MAFLIDLSDSTEQSRVRAAPERKTGPELPYFPLGGSADSLHRFRLVFPRNAHPYRTVT